MAFTVRLIFEGVVAFVPDVPLNFKSPADVKKVDVFWPDLRRPHDSSKDISGSSLRRPHFLWIEAEEAATKKSDWPIALRTGATKAHYLVKSQLALTLKTTGPPAKLEADQGLPSNQFDPTQVSPNDKRSLWWIMKPQELTSEPYHGVILEGLQKMAHLELTSGELYAASFSNNGKLWGLAEYFEPSQGKTPIAIKGRGIANALGLDLTVDSFELHGTDTDGTTKKVVVEAATGATVELFLRNVEPESLLGVEFPLVGPDPDFAEFYRCSAGRHLYPWVLPHSASPIGSERKPCAPAIMARTL